MKPMIPIWYKAIFNRLAICVLEDLVRCFYSSDPNYEYLLAAFDHQLDPQRLSVVNSLRIIQFI